MEWKKQKTQALKIAKSITRAIVWIHFTGNLHLVTPFVHLLIAVFNNSAISGTITNFTHGVTHITRQIKFPKISTLAKRDSLVLIFWGISIGGRWVAF